VLPSALVCSLDASHRFEPERLYATCPSDGAPLLVDYPRPSLDRAAVARGPWSMWRYREMLPVDSEEEPVTLGEGCTPLVPAPHVASELRLDVPLYVKDESQNPTGSFKSRGMSVAVTRARRLGATALVAPSAGNAGGALAAYGARARLAVTVFLPRDTPPILVEECETYGARVKLVDGLIDDAGKRAAEFASTTGAFNMATLREPYRIEGKKTMAYELVEQLGEPPAAILYPTGGGTGLIGMWKAFDELEACGWIGRQRPQMIAVQADGCAPIVRAFDENASSARPWDDASTAAWGLRVPAALGDRLMLRAIRESGGTAIAVTEAGLLGGMHAMRTREGVDASEEGGAAFAALRIALERGLRPQGPVVLFNTGSALKYAPRGAVEAGRASFA
jgi:threonine synthase